MPPSLANRLALSREISDSRPILTRAVFSLTPVSSDALLRIRSSILIVVLICTYMHYLYIYVKKRMNLIEAPPTAPVVSLHSQGRRAARRVLSAEGKLKPGG